MKSLSRYFCIHFWRLARRGKWSFLWRTWLETVLFAYLVLNVVHRLFPVGPRSDLAQMTVLGLLGSVVLFGPLVETLLFQCLPLEVTAELPVRRSIRIAFSVVPFALGHYFAGIPTVAAAGLVGGFYFAFTYERWRKESLMVAVAMTFLIHASFNLVGVLGMLLFPGN